MRPTRALLAATLLTLALPASAGAATGWRVQDVARVTPDRSATGVPATGAGGTAVLLTTYARTGPAHAAQPVTLRRARADGRLGPEVRLAAARTVDDLALSTTASGAVAAFRAVVGSGRGTNHRLLALRVGADGSPGEPVDLSGAGSSAYDPAFVPGAPTPTLVWSRRSGPLEATSDVDAGRAGVSALPTPVAGVADLSLAAGPAGQLVAAAEPGALARGSLAAGATDPVALPPREGFLDPQVALGADGTALVAWLQGSPGHAQVAVARVRPGADAAEPADVLDTRGSALTPPVVAASGQVPGAGCVGWVVTSRRGVRARTTPGALRLGPLTAGGSLRPAALGTPGERGSALALSTVPSGVLATWVGASGRLRAQAYDGRAGLRPPVTLARGVDPASVRVAAADGRVAVAFSDRRALRLATTGG